MQQSLLLSLLHLCCWYAEMLLMSPCPGCRAARAGMVVACCNHIKWRDSTNLVVKSRPPKRNMFARPAPLRHANMPWQMPWFDCSNMFDCSWCWTVTGSSVGRRLFPIGWSLWSLSLVMAIYISIEYAQYASICMIRIDRMITLYIQLAMLQ